jgi:hypothetical protein
VCLWVGTNDAKQERSLEQTLVACEAVLDQCHAAGRFVYLATLPGKTGFMMLAFMPLVKSHR